MDNEKEDKYERRRRILHSLPHTSSIPADLDVKEEYHKHLIEKYIERDRRYLEEKKAAQEPNEG